MPLTRKIKGHAHTTLYKLIIICSNIVHISLNSHYDALIKKKTDNSLSDALSDLNTLDLKVSIAIFFSANFNAYAVN